MDGSLKIESGIPIPKVYKGARTPHGIIVKKMQVGQSILVESIDDANKIRDLMRYYYGEGCYRWRKVPDGWRLWRVK